MKKWVVMKRQVFYSFHYGQDSRRVAQIRNIGAIEGIASVSDNDLKKVKKVLAAHFCM